MQLEDATRTKENRFLGFPFGIPPADKSVYSSSYLKTEPGGCGEYWDIFQPPNWIWQGDWTLGITLNPLAGTHGDDR